MGDPDMVECLNCLKRFWSDGQDTFCVDCERRLEIINPQKDGE